MNKVLIQSIKSRIITEKSDLLKVIITALQGHDLRDGDILVISSKAVSVTEKRIRKISNKQQYAQLVKRESDKYLGGKFVSLTVKKDIFTPWAGIDRSNVPEGYVALWPVNPFRTAANIREKLMSHYKLKKLGVIVADSFCAPLRRGTIAVAIGYAGFVGVDDLKGKKDLYGNKMMVSRQAHADMLATAAQFVMGETNESTPFAIISGANVKFTNRKINRKEPIISTNECLYSPLYGKKIKK